MNIIVQHDTVKYVMYYLLPYFAAFPVIAICYDHLVAKIDTTHECMVCAYDPRFIVQCISSAIESRYRCDWFLSAVVAETTKLILFLTCVSSIPRLLTHLKRTIQNMFF